MRVGRWALLLIAAAVFAVEPAQAKKDQSKSEAEEIPTASIYGMTGERYELYGTGGITVDESPRPGFIHSNMKSYRIRIDGSGTNGADAAASAIFAPTPVDTDFIAAANGAYFVSHTATCALPTAAGVAGKEIIVCNTGDGTITYSTRFGETMSGYQTLALRNSTPGHVDRFISDGKNWYKE
jgi:hypothetical protein